MGSFTNAEGSIILDDLIKQIQANKQYLSDIDGTIGDGDHGINMNKGFTLCADELANNPGDLAHGLKTLSKILMTKIGGAMGPLYGMLFRSMAKECDGKDNIDAAVFAEMLKAIETSIQKISKAKVGDKTLVDTLAPAIRAYCDSVKGGKSFSESLETMKQAAVAGRDSTKDMLARIGRASRLGERSRGVLDPGATSCCLILISIADSVQTLLN
jgi:phosphoenolpyruvate---glycerone phosphotransferase subunit DhaL